MKENLVSEDEAEPQMNSINTENTLGEIFKDDPDEFSEWEQKSCCSKCCHYLFCCCCCTSYEKSKSSYRKGWRKFLVNEGNDSADKPFQILTKLFTNEENAIEGLEDIRFNPNLVSENKLRNDLEFYIPQLCTFLLFGEVKALEEFFVFLCRVCNTSFFFAHRVHWFLSAMINSAQDKKDDVIKNLKNMNTLFLSETKKGRKKLEKFYISNSEKYINYIKKNKLYFLYDGNITENENIFDKVEFNSLNSTQQQIFNKFKNSRELIASFSQDEYNEEKEKEINKLKEQGKFNNITNEDLINTKQVNEEKETIKTDIINKDQKFKPDEFFIDLSNFKLNNPDVTQEADDILEVEEKDEDGSQKQSLLYDENNSDDFINVEKIDRDINFISYHSTLNFIDHLCDISNDLPKYTIEEQKLFLFKKINEVNKKLPCNVYLPFLKDSIRNYLICHIPIDGVKIFRTKTRCPIMLTFEMVRIEEINQEIEKDGIPEIGNTRMTVSPTNLNLGKNKGDDKLLLDIISERDNEFDEADYDLSKPMKIAKNKKKEKKDKNKNKKDNKNKKIKNEANYMEDKKFQKIIDKFKNQNKLILFSDRTNAKTFYKKNAPSLDDIDIEIDTSSKEKQPKNKNEDNIENIQLNNEINNIDTDNEILPNDDQNQINKSINYEDFSNIFGETFEEKEKNLKSKSLFGNFKSYKIFRCIFKTHEDLRQEQFATQLINEFNQIFKLENVDCWLNTYEIISTGNDSGLVEMVNNTLSLDQLKQKINNISLHDFYLYYWGKGHTDSPAYKNAMKNYVESLAGYSLVCYFLQIKDRHNGNILIDNEGHLTHIDFGFLLSNAPGKGLKFEKAPFKLSHDMVQNLGGDKGQYFEQFRKLLKKGFLAVHKHREKIIILVEMMWCGNGRNLDCFEKGQETIDNLRERLAPKNCEKKVDIFKYVDSLIEQSVDNWRTKWYDIFQYYVQGIFY